MTKKQTISKYRKRFIYLVWANRVYNGRKTYLSTDTLSQLSEELALFWPHRYGSMNVDLYTSQEQADKNREAKVFCLLLCAEMCK